MREEELEKLGFAHVHRQEHNQRIFLSLDVDISNVIIHFLAVATLLDMMEAWHLSK